MDLQNGCMHWDKILGRCEAALGDVMPKNLRPQTNYIVGNRQRTKLKHKARVPTEILESEAEFGVWGVKIKHKDAQDIYPWSPQTKPNTSTSESMSRAVHENPTKRLEKDKKHSS
jgi:hypothetical protein